LNALILQGVRALLSEADLENESSFSKNWVFVVDGAIDLVFACLEGKLTTLNLLRIQVSLRRLFLPKLIRYCYAMAIVLARKTGWGDRAVEGLGGIFLPNLLNGRLCRKILRLLNYVERFSVMFGYSGYSRK
jgi:hypothetical protein